MAAGVAKSGTARYSSLPGSVAMSKLMQGAAQYAKSAPKGAPRKVHQDAAQDTSKSATRRRNFYEKGAPKGAHMAFSFLN